MRFEGLDCVDRPFLRLNGTALHHRGLYRPCLNGSILASYGSGSLLYFWPSICRHVLNNGPVCISSCDNMSRACRFLINAIAQRFTHATFQSIAQRRFIAVEKNASIDLAR
jgi:hypothetical protein